MEIHLTNAPSDERRRNNSLCLFTRAKGDVYERRAVGGEGRGDGCQREWEEAEETAKEEDHPTPLSRTAPKRIFFFPPSLSPTDEKTSRRAASDCSGSSIFRSFQTKPQLSSLFFLQRKRITTSMEKRSKKRQEGGKHNLPPPPPCKYLKIGPNTKIQQLRKLAPSPLDPSLLPYLNSF